MKEFLSQHTWILYLALFALAFILNTIRRLFVESRRMPREKKLELNLRWAGRALRKLGRAKRILHRYITVRNAAPASPIPDMVRRLWKASSDAADAKNHLSEVLKKVPGLGCSIDMLQNLDRSIQIAEDVHEECRQAVRGKINSNARPAAITQEEMRALVRESTDTLDRVRAIVKEWAEESKQASQTLAVTTDPVIYRSSGFLRNPLKPEDSLESGQAETMISLTWTMEDLNRINQCIDALQKALNALSSFPLDNNIETAGFVTNALDSVDIALGDAELPLPTGLVTGETPFGTPVAEELSGALQQIYARLTMVEAAFTPLKQNKGQAPG